LSRERGLDQGAGLVTRDAKLRFGIGQRDPIRFGIDVEQTIVVLDRGVRSSAMATT
jgi:hypothetical protein